jgi:allantoate deiminase
MSGGVSHRAEQVIARCRKIASITDVEGETTRLFLSRATQGAHSLLLSWMCRAGLEARTDAVGSLRGLRRSAIVNAPTLILFSHIDTVPNAGAFDGVLGILLSLAVLEELHSEPLPFHIELIAFSEEEGIRFGFPFLSSLAAIGHLTANHLQREDSDGTSLADAIRNFELDPEKVEETCGLPQQSFAALELHIEQGPILDSENLPLGVVQSIIGQSRMKLTFEGQANHAGTTPMALRHDALAAAAQWVYEVERFALEQTQLVATVGKLDVLPGAINVVPGSVTATLDVRHPSDAARHAAVGILLTKAQHAAELRGVQVEVSGQSDQCSVPMNVQLVQALNCAAERAGIQTKMMFSGAGHDAMILAPHVPTAMLFVRSPNGLSHHPDETVHEADVEAALLVTLECVRGLRPKQ